MAQKYVVFISHGVYVDVDEDIDPDNNEGHYEELRTRAVMKLWQQGYDSCRTECEIEYEDVSEEFGLRKENK